VVLEKDGEDQLDRWCEERRSVTYRYGAKEHPSYNKKDGIGHTLRRNYLLKHVIEEKIEVMRRRGRRHKQLLNDPKETRRYSKLTEGAKYGTQWRTGYEGAIDPS
jgi:hypothetical protein